MNQEHITEATLRRRLIAFQTTAPLLQASVDTDEVGIKARSMSARSHLLLLVTLVLVGIRPVVDLAGSYDSQGFTPGPILSLVTACLAWLTFLHFPWTGSRPLRRAFLSLLLLLGLGTTHVIVASALNYQLMPTTESLSRVFASLSFVLLYPYILAQRLSARRAFSIFLAVFFVAVLFPITISWLQHSGYYAFSYYDYVDGARIGRPSGGYRQPNSLGRLMVFCELLMVPAISTAARRRRTSLVTICTFMLILCALTVFISTHRTSIISFGMIGVIIGFCLLVKRGMLNRLAKYYSLIGWLLGMACIAAILLYWWNGIKFGGFFSSFEHYWELLRNLIVGNEFDTFRGRSPIWSKSWQYFTDRNTLGILFGGGYVPWEAHNDVLNILLKWGAVGLLLYGFFIWGVLQFCWKRCTGLGKTMLVGNALFLCLFAVSLHPTDYTLYMWLWGLTCAATFVFFPRY